MKRMMHHANGRDNFEQRDALRWGEDGALEEGKELEGDDSDGVHLIKHGSLASRVKSDEKPAAKDGDVLKPTPVWFDCDPGHDDAMAMVPLPCLLCWNSGCCALDSIPTASHCYG
jgi:hypothetical protein